MADPDTPSYVSLSDPQRSELNSFLSRGDGFFVVPSQDLPSVIPEKLRTKWDSAVAVISGSAISAGAIILLGHRIDLPVSKLDHHPFAVAVSSGSAAVSGVFVDHLSSTSRSIDLPSEFTSAFIASGISNYFYNNPPFQVASGSLSELPAPTKEAIGIVLNLLPKS